MRPMRPKPLIATLVSEPAAKVRSGRANLQGLGAARLGAEAEHGQAFAGSADEDALADGDH
eukprot:14625918-Heterocapsa_arctica.AAC.1